MKKCPDCGSERIIYFDADNDICNDCGNTFPGVLTGTVNRVVNEINDDLRQEKTPETCSCLQKLKPGEPFFVLRGQDVSSPQVVLDWVAKNFENVPDDKLLEAFVCALKMKHYSPRKAAD